MIQFLIFFSLTLIISILIIMGSLMLNQTIASIGLIVIAFCLIILLVRIEQAERRHKK